MIIVAISDVHNRHEKIKIPECDLLIVAGDYTSQGYEHEVRNFHIWLNKQPARHKIVVQGNHEKDVERNFNLMKSVAETACPGVIFVEHELVVIEGIKIFCSAYTPWFYDWAYNVERDVISNKWKDIPMDTEILVTHGPPHGILDQVYQVDGVTPRERVGCYALMEKLVQLPKLHTHIFGHIHSSHGKYAFKDIMFYNVAICGETYYPDYQPTLLEVV